MLKFTLAALALTIGVYHTSVASDYTLSTDFTCTSLEKISEVLKKYEEEPMLTMVSHRIDDSNQYVALASVLFVNPKTGSFTMVEKVTETVYCVSAMGNNLSPYVPKGELL